LNVCKLRSLYRTLLTVDFAAKTDERPDPNRNYKSNDWLAYRKSQQGSQAHEAHEIVDQFWLSSAVSHLSSSNTIRLLADSILRSAARSASWISLPSIKPRV